MKIVLVGLGVVGGSFAEALKDAGYTEVYGIDTNPSTIAKALEWGWITGGSADGSAALRQADLVILSLYPRLVQAFIEEHRDDFRPGVVLTDVTGIKKTIIDEVMAVLPSTVDFIFGHPMAGREKKGIDYASGKVFQGANYLLTPLPSNQEVHLQQLEALIKELGFGSVTRITPAFHDEIIGFTSQLPHSIAVALVNSDVEGRETGRFVGDSYRDLTRIANINEDLWSELFLGNKENLLGAIEHFEWELAKIKSALRQDDNQTLKKLFIQATKRREQL